MLLELALPTHSCPIRLYTFSFLESITKRDSRVVDG